MTREFRLVDADTTPGDGRRPGSAKVRRRVLLADSIHWSGARSGDDVTDDDRRRILDRIQLVYDKWGHVYDVVGGLPLK